MSARIVERRNRFPALTNIRGEQDLPAYIECPADASALFAIWPVRGLPEDSESQNWHEKTMQAPGWESPCPMARNVAIPTLTMFQPAKKSGPGTAMIVCPGGAFHFLMMDYEGYDVARWLAGLGIAAFVLKYRLQRTPDEDDEMEAFMRQLSDDLNKVSQTEIHPPSTHSRMEEARLWAEEDGRQAIRFVRQHAGELGLNPNRIGIIGFSAGGGVAVNSALQHDSLSRPDFVAGIYPAYRRVNSMPNELPPLFLAISDDDKAVAPMSSARLYEEWHKVGQWVELHIFSNGAHGFGMRKKDLLSDSWSGLFRNWLDAQGLLPTSN